jgi:S1-C subfamily serine protease
MNIRAYSFILFALVICAGAAPEVEALQVLDGGLEEAQEPPSIPRKALHQAWRDEENEATLDNGDDAFLLGEDDSGQALTQASSAAKASTAAPAAVTAPPAKAPAAAAPAAKAPATPAAAAPAQPAVTPVSDDDSKGEKAEASEEMVPIIDNLVKIKADVDKIQGSDWMKILEDHRDGVVQIMVVKKKFLWKAAYRAPLSVEVSGSGWFIDNSEFSVDTKNEMLIVTNAHVAKNAEDLNILIPSLGQEPIKAEVVGLCSQRDIAILKVSEPERLLALYKAKTGKDSITKMKLGDSDEMKRGANCMAVGYPLGLKSVKASMGIVSGYQQFKSALYLQITAPINPGNSGGPLFNDEGRVVGINSAKIAQASGMSFSIASVQLKVMLDVLYSRRQFIVPFLGYKFSVGTKLLHQYLHVEADTMKQGGIYITSVQPTGLFELAGVKRGDLLLTVDGAEIDRFGQTWMPTMKDNINILGLLARKKVGTDLVLGVWRATEKKMLSLSVKYDSTKPFAIPYIYEPILDVPKFQEFAGIVLMELSLNMVSVLLQSNVAGLIKYTKPENRMTPRIVIAGVIPGSLAALDGSIKAGLLLDTINGKEVSSMKDVCAVLAEQPAEWWTVSTRETFTAFKVEQVSEFNKGTPTSSRSACSAQ